MTPNSVSSKPGAGHVAHLAEGVFAPALDRTRPGQRAGVSTARRHTWLHKDPPCHRDVACRVLAVAQLTTTVFAPAVDRARAGQRAGVIRARRDGEDAAGKPAH